MRSLSFKMGDQTLIGKAQKIKDTLWVHLNGETFIYKQESKSKRSQGHHIIAGVVNAPMPGKITKINVKTGDSVEAGQVLVIMEAMKMEYSLRGDKAGKIKSISCRVGDQVHLGQTLLEID